MRTWASAFYLNIPPMHVRSSMHWFLHCGPSPSSIHSSSPHSLTLGSIWSNCDAHFVYTYQSKWNETKKNGICKRDKSLLDCSRHTRPQNSKSKIVYALRALYATVVATAATVTLGPYHAFRVDSTHTSTHTHTLQFRFRFGSCVCVWRFCAFRQSHRYWRRTRPSVCVCVPAQRTKIVDRTVVNFTFNRINVSFFLSFQLHSMKWLIADKIITTKQKNMV